MKKLLVELFERLFNKFSSKPKIISKSKKILTHNIKYYSRLKGVHPSLIKLLEEVSAYIPLIVLPDGGVRTLKRQRELVKKGVSKTLNSKHIKKGEYGMAVDVAPYYNNKVDWTAISDFAWMNGYIKAKADLMGIKIRQGCKWNKKTVKENGFKDFPHQELV